MFYTIVIIVGGSLFVAAIINLLIDVYDQWKDYNP